MRSLPPYLVCLALVASYPATARLHGAAGQEGPATNGRKRASATRVGSGTIRVDGRLDEDVWRQATPVIDFVQKEPTEGAEPTDPMEVRFVYDDRALYVGARMFTRNAPGIQAPLARRDGGEEQTEHILVSLDTFLDHRTAVTFGVTASGVRLDRFHPSDNENSFDAGFDPVWEARTIQDSEGWTAELWIPFSQLRFSPRAVQVWGLNLRRFRPTLNEEDYWVLIPRTERFWSSRFGELHGIAGVRPTRRIELLPYLAGQSTQVANPNPNNPFERGLNLATRGGADLKMGFGPNLTLEATVNPDFGQVEADAAEVNLTAFETRFPEKRPFFLEGAQLFNIGHPNFYYSRRIGARPIGPVSGDFVDYPTASTIVAAAKLTGRLPSRTSLGILSAVTDEESARFATSEGAIDRVRVGPRAFWTAARAQQEFGALGSTAGLIVTGVHRDLPAGDPLARLLSRNALAVGADTVLRFKNGEYEFRWAGGGSFVDGEPEAIERTQRGSAHYAQRPDKDYARLDPTRTSLSGFSMQTRFERASGRHWLWNLGTKYDTPFFDTTDVANLIAADGIMPSGEIRFRETRPGRLFRNYAIGVNQTWEWNLGGDRQTARLRPFVNVTWLNFWTSSISFSRTLRTQDATLTRGGPLMQRPRGWTTTWSLGNRATAVTRWSGSVTVGGDEEGGATHRFTGTFSFRPGPRWQLSMEPFYDRVTEPQQYVRTIAGGRPETYGSRYIFAYLDRTTASTAFRMGFTVKPDMTVDVYAEPFAASGHYYDFGELLAPGIRERLTYGDAGTQIETGPDGSRAVTAGDSRFTLPTRDFNTLSFRSNVVLRWEWRAGSTLFVVWQQDRSDTRVSGARVDLADMFRSVTSPGTNSFIIKTSFWLPVN